ncbi:hypothetical protein PUR34_38690 [Streptomyces sp. JV185]|uniref:hypothetical protein n=1 Tax=Streptomyces sp. JV185 TaxID=858638 RepID=UPI002E7A9AAF|nr:hypothetical protein [Streptomyces sp. JV185]MEE1773944.1 hypothetical protein [Streptomyces sp. JV185]
MRWTAAACPGGRALFTLHPASGNGPSRRPPSSDADLAYERAVLKVFAERSAKARGGCSAPVSP